MKKNHHFNGLTDAEVLKSRKECGENILTPPKRESLWKQFINKFEDPLIRILIVAGILSIGISCYEYFNLNGSSTVFFEPIGIFVAIILATGLAFYFELKANKAFSILNQVNDDELVKVIRNNNVIEIPKKEVVVGDIIVLNTGDEVPADGELLESVTLKVDESSLTGEPICEKTTIVNEFDLEATYPSNYLLRGTKVIEGHGIFKVVEVGDKTENGKVFEEAQIDDSIKTPLNEQLDGLSDLITNLSYGFATFIIIGRLCLYFGWSPLSFTLIFPTIIFFYLVIKKFEEWSSKLCVVTILVFFILFIGMIIGLHSYLMPNQELAELLAFTMNTLMIAVTLIVVAVPEGLPMAVTLSLAYSMRSMLRTNNLVRKMHACETMGATTVICTDKTGTLTQNKMQVYNTNFYDLENQKLTKNSMISDIIAEGISINSTASLDFSANVPNVIGNPTEGALLLWLNSQGIDYRNFKDNAEIIDEIPFSTERKYMATIAKSSISGNKILFVKGAPEIIYKMSSKTSKNISKDDIDKQLISYQKQAMRTLGFAYQVVEDNDKLIFDKEIISENLTFLGIIAISDPVRLDVPQAVKECMSAGIEVKIVTGDTSGTAKEIGRQIGLCTDFDSERNIITGPELSLLSDKQLEDRVNDLKIIARARPMDKKRLVETLQKKNQVVAVTGDGTNDAPALNTAHVGLSMGDGTSVAKEASDITIIDNSFSSIGRAVMWGRSLYQNIKRFLLFQLTVNVSACFIVLIGAFIGTESPLTVTQMLWVNLIMDTFGAMALASLPPSESVMKCKPRNRTSFIINKQMFYNILGVGMIFFLMLLGLVLVCEFSDITSMKDFLSLSLGRANNISPYEQTIIFSIFVWTHFWYMFNARSFETGKSIFQCKLSSGFMTIVLVIAIGQIIIVEGLYDFFNVVPMKLEDWIIIVIGSSIVVWIREIWKLITGFKK